MNSVNGIIPQNSILHIFLAPDFIFTLFIAKLAILILRQVVKNNDKQIENK